MRLGVFHRQLLQLAEKPCVLTITIAATGSRIVVTGVLRAYHSLSSLHGWALVPPQQHGGFAAMRLTQLNLAEATQRDVILDNGGHRLRFTVGETVFELQRDKALLTPPPRTTRKGRYLYVGGRRRTVPEPWMLR